MLSHVAHVIEDEIHNGGIIYVDLHGHRCGCFWWAAVLILAGALILAELLICVLNKGRARRSRR